MNYLVARIRHGDAKAIRRFIMTARRSRTVLDACQQLNMSRSLFYTVRTDLRAKGHLL